MRLARVHHGGRVQVIALFLLAQLVSTLGRRPVEPAVAMTGTSRTYHRVPVAQMATTKWTHVESCGVVTLVQLESDGDVHLRVSDGPAFLIAEIIPLIPLPSPKKGQTIRVRGISRIDHDHGSWAEIHPCEEIIVVPSCASQTGSTSPGSSGARRSIIR